MGEGEGEPCDDAASRAGSPPQQKRESERKRRKKKAAAKNPKKGGVSAPADPSPKGGRRVECLGVLQSRKSVGIRLKK